MDSVSSTPGAKRGDLAVVERHTSFHTVSGGSTTSTDVDVCVVVGITRDGHVRKVRDARGLEHDVVGKYAWFGFRRVLLASAREVDVEACMTEARGHVRQQYGSPVSYASVDEARAAVAQHRR